MAKKPYDFKKLTWEEVNQAVEKEKLCLLPVGTIEDHGLHLPIDTDVLIVEEICNKTAELVSDEIVLLPCIDIGYSPHHIDGPGVLTIKWDTFVNYVKDVTTSLAYHGFNKILIVNGHGSNKPVLELAARLTVVENPDVQCAVVSWWDLKDVQEEVKKFRESEWTGHACELETSVYLAVDPGNVHMDLAEADASGPLSKHFYLDLVGDPPEGYANPVYLTEYWSTVCKTGTWGDPTVATAAKGEAIVKAAAKELSEIILELKNRPIRERVPHQLERVTQRNKRMGKN